MVRVVTTDTYLISSIQQGGVGVTDVPAAFRWHCRAFGLDMPVPSIRSGI